VPIGLINSSYGGTPGENWIDRQAMDGIPELKGLLDNYEKAVLKYPADLDKYKTNETQLLEKWEANTALAKQQNNELPRKPSAPSNPAERGGPGGLYNTMIYPLVPFAIKGVVWYQGEANGSRGIQYRYILPALINNWRSVWGEGNFPFLIIQIPGWKGHHPELREAQLLSYKKIPNTSLTVITDVDDTLNVHPGNKQPVGERLSLAAFALAYNSKAEYEGPIYESMEVVGNKIEITFSHTGSGLMAKNGDLRDFVIAGADKKFVPAKAEIKGSKVIVYSDNVTDPVTVRLGWRLSPQINLYNKEGLCAAAFRTDVASDK
jgi:sialate O-acetylesterase